MHFEVFIPAADTSPTLESVGLAHLHSGADAIAHTVQDRPGTLYGWLNPKRPRMRCEWPQWIPAAAHDELITGRYLIGFDPEQPATPSELARPNRFRQGTHIELGDGNQWLIPHVDELPADMILADDGSIQYVRQRQFVDFGIECDLWRQRIAAGETTGDDRDLYWFAYRALRLNYRITPEMITALRLLNNQNLHRPVLAVLGGYVLRDQQQEAADG